MALMIKLAMLLILLAALVPSYGAQSLEKEGDEEKLRGYNQWVAFHITYIGSGSVQVLNSNLNWGKWYNYPNKDSERSTVNGVQIGSGGNVVIVAASGRSGAASGTEGTFDIFYGGQKLVHIYFNCPYSGKNSISKTTFGSVLVDISGWSTSGNLGDINLKIGYFGSDLQQA